MLRKFVTAAVMTAAFTAPVTVAASGADAATVVSGAHAVSAGKHPCTHTSTGTCIRGGQFCPQASYGHAGWDAQGRRYVCKGDRVHPHWMK